MWPVETKTYVDDFQNIAIMLFILQPLKHTQKEKKYPLYVSRLLKYKLKTDYYKLVILWDIE